jgi:hypothetical protein
MIVASSMLVLGRRFTLVERSHTLVSGVLLISLLVLVQEEVSGSLRTFFSVYSTIQYDYATHAHTRLVRARSCFALV